MNETPDRDEDPTSSPELSQRRPPVQLPLALSKLPPGRHALPRKFVLENQRARLLSAALAVFGERGYLETSVGRLAKAAGTSRSTFYTLFEDKAACFLATYEAALDRLESEVLAAVAEADGWPRQVGAATSTVLSALAEDPRTARVCATEVHVAGAAVRARQARLTEQVGIGLSRGRVVQPSAKQLPSLLEPMLVGGAFFLVNKAVTRGETAELPELAPQLSELFLLPYLGAEEARRLATGPR